MSSESGSRKVRERGTHVGNVQVVLRHVKTDRDVREVENWVQNVAVQDESLNQADKCERYVTGGENITADA